MMLWKKYKTILLLAGSLISISPISMEANAAKLIKDSVAKGYSNCSYEDNRDGTGIFRTTIHYKQSINLVEESFYSRSILIYIYDKDGNPTSTTKNAIVFMNGKKYGRWWRGNGYYVFNGVELRPDPNSAWLIKEPFSANVEVFMEEKDTKDWPAIAIQAGNFMSRNDYIESSGAAYIQKDGVSDFCQKATEPEVPTPVDIYITVKAPDWNLGDLPEGDVDKTLSKINERLCFEYNLEETVNQKFFISASNENGVLNKRYQLNNVADSSQKVPYHLKLDNGKTSFSLPNSNIPLKLDDSSGQTCFVPTFTTSVGKNTKEGDYTDILTFTITTKS